MSEKLYNTPALLAEISASNARAQAKGDAGDSTTRILVAVIRHISSRAVSRMELLESRLEALERRPAMSYLGVWDPRSEYAEGQFVTDRGSVFYCRRTTRERPGSSADWQLAVKRGADGKDAAK